MRNLILLEIDKMIHKKSFYISLALVFCYCVAIYMNKTGLFVSSFFRDTDETQQVLYGPWNGMLQSLVTGLFSLNLFVLIAVSPLFSEEHTFRMNALLFTSKCGRKKCFAAKNAAAYLMGLALVLTVVLLHIFATLILFGGAGVTSSIQSAGTKTVGSAVVAAIWLYTADVLFTISITVLASVLTSGVLTGTVLSFAFFAVPMIFLEGFQEVRIKFVMPAVHRTDFEKIVSIYPLNVGSIGIPYSYVITGILLLFTVIIMAVTARIYETLPEEGIMWF